MNKVEDFQENYITGYVSVWRSIMDHWIFHNDKYFKWWIIMLFEVNWEDNSFNRYGNFYTIKRGQSCNSLRRWSHLFSTTPKTVSKFFSLLEKDEMITKKKIGKGKQALTLITIRNYNDYQKTDKQRIPQGVQTNNKIINNNTVVDS